MNYGFFNSHFSAPELPISIQRLIFAPDGHKRIHRLAVNSHPHPYGIDISDLPEDTSHYTVIDDFQAFARDYAKACHVPSLIEFAFFDENKIYFFFKYPPLESFLEHIYITKKHLEWLYSSENPTFTLSTVEEFVNTHYDADSIIGIATIKEYRNGEIPSRFTAEELPVWGERFLDKRVKHYLDDYSVKGAIILI